MSDDHPDVRPWFHTTTEPGPYTDDPAQDGPMREWMIAQGYPKALADQNLDCTFTATEETT